MCDPAHFQLFYHPQLVYLLDMCYLNQHFPIHRELVYLVVHLTGSLDYSLISSALTRFCSFPNKIKYKLFMKTKISNFLKCSIKTSIKQDYFGIFSFRTEMSMKKQIMPIRMTSLKIDVGIP